MESTIHQTDITIPWSSLRIPPFPAVALKVLRLVQDENVSLSQISTLISTDPAFSSEALTVVNSFIYSQRQMISSIPCAVVTLGARRIQGIALTVGVRMFLGTRMGLGTMKRLWHHSLASAIIAEQLAQAGDSVIDPDTAYTIAMLHDIGRMAMALVKPEEYQAVLDAVTDPEAEALDAERALFGLDHCQVGAKLCTQWTLPGEFALTLEQHHQPRDAEGAWNAVELIKMSCRFSDAAGYSAFQHCPARDFDALIAQLPERERGEFHQSLASLKEELAASIQSLEK